VVEISEMDAEMKIRSPWLIKALGFVVALVVRIWLGTVRYRYRPLARNVDPNRMRGKDRFIYAFWHENLLLPAYHYGRRDIWVLISQHSDGELIAQACRHLGFRLVRGSPKKGASDAVRKMLRLAEKDHLALTPDGPRGPRRKVQPGLIFLAVHTGRPIIPVGFAWEKAWRMKSWDRFALPVPWSGAICVTGEPILIPKIAEDGGLEVYRQQVQAAMDEVSAAAEQRIGKEPARAEGRQVRKAA
jgi:lysophospholipid acyltransferase (LPLAT)-like uncharacterized protein